MNFPKYIDLGSDTVALKKTPRADMGKLYGETWQTEDGHIHIQVGAELSPRIEASTLFHELLHAIEFLNGMDLGEERVRVLDNGFATFCRLNPQLAREMVKEMTK